MECQKHNKKFTVAECANLNGAREALAQIFQGLDIAQEAHATRPKTRYMT